jgi:hypothetical protein
MVSLTISMAMLLMMQGGRCHDGLETHLQRH